MRITARELTRRSLLASAAGALAGGLLRPREALARAAPVDALGTARPSRYAARRAAQAQAALVHATPVLQAGGGQPPIIAREAWARGRCPPRVAPEYGAVELGFVHHTENPNGYPPGAVPGMLRAIYAFHRYTNGWNDIGYNFVIDRFGRIFEARAGGIDEPVTGAHAGGYNYCSTGVAVLGEYGGVRISPAARAALVRLLAWKLALHGTPIAGRVVVRVNPQGAVYSRFPANARVSLPRVAGHRDADSTDCPGNVLYGELPGVRVNAEHVQGTPAQLTLALGAAPAAAPAPTPAPAPSPAPAPAQAPAEGAPPAEPPGETPPPAPVAVLAGRLALLDGSPLAGAAIAVQARHVSRRGEVVKETTVAQAQTAPDGSWSLPLYAPAVGGPGGPGAVASAPVAAGT